MFYSGFNFMFTLVPVFIGVIFVIVIVMLIRNAKEWHHNNQQPIIPVPAKIVSKRQSTHTHADVNTNMHTSDTTYYVTFEFSNGERTEMRVSGHEYGKLAENDIGTLSMQGTRYISFERR